MVETLDENAVIRRVVEGDVEAFTSLIERYQRPVFAFVGNMVDDRLACEDIVQDTFFAAYEHLAGFDPGRASFATWLFTIARNRTLKELEKRGRRPVPISLDGPAARVVPSADRHGERELRLALEGALAGLCVEERTTFVLLELADRSVQEVAQLEGIAESSVRSRLSRGRAKLRAALGLEGGSS